MADDLPIGWVKTELGEITQIDMGQSPSGNATNEDGIGLPLVGGASDFKGDTIKPSRFTSIPTKICDPDDLILCIRATIGKLALAKEPYCLGRGVAGIRSCKGINRNWLKYYLVSDAQKLDASGTGSTFRQIDKSTLVSWKILLPPLNEQRRIVEKLDRIMERLRRARHELSHIKKLIDRYKQAVLASACSSESYENGEIVNIQSVAHVGTGSTPLKSNSSYYADIGTPWITSAATNQSFVTEASEFVTEYAISECRLRKYPVGTLLVAMYGEGKTRGQVTELAIEATINQACAAIIVNESLACKEYVKLSLQANYLEMRELAEGGNQPNLNLSKIKNFLIFFPPLEEQKEIVRRVEERFAKIDRVEQEYQKAVKLCDRLEQATLAKAFRGELVPQDPNDEPASVLLERIRAERQAQSQGKATKSRRKPKAT